MPCLSHMRSQYLEKNYEISVRLNLTSYHGTGRMEDVKILYRILGAIELLNEFISDEPSKEELEIIYQDLLGEHFLLHETLINQNVYTNREEKNKDEKSLAFILGKLDILDEMISNDTQAEVSVEDMDEEEVVRYLMSSLSQSRRNEAVNLLIEKDSLIRKVEYLLVEKREKLSGLEEAEITDLIHAIRRARFTKRSI